MSRMSLSKDMAKKRKAKNNDSDDDTEKKPLTGRATVSAKLREENKENKASSQNNNEHAEAKAFGRILASAGAGAATGAAIVGAGGTVVLPGVGSVIGAAGGAAAGTFYGAVTGTAAEIAYYAARDKSVDVDPEQAQKELADAQNAAKHATGRHKINADRRLKKAQEAVEVATSNGINQESLVDQAVSEGAVIGAGPAAPVEEAETKARTVGGENSNSITTLYVRKGATGVDVETIQNVLNQNGANLKVDGILGKNTDAAIRAFQESHGLIADGAVGPDTMKAMELEYSRNLKFTVEEAKDAGLGERPFPSSSQTTQDKNANMGSNRNR